MRARSCRTMQQHERCIDTFLTRVRGLFPVDRSPLQKLGKPSAPNVVNGPGAAKYVLIKRRSFASVTAVGRVTGIQRIDWLVAMPFLGEPATRPV